MEDELQLIHQELGAARRRLWSLEAAPYEGRVGDEQEWAASVARTRERVRELERELRAAEAELVAAGMSVLDDLREHGWFGLSGEQQDAVIEAGWHPGPLGGCGRRVKGGVCGSKGLCPACWADRNPRQPQGTREEGAADG